MNTLSGTTNGGSGSSTPLSILVVSDNDEFAGGGGGFNTTSGLVESSTSENPKLETLNIALRAQRPLDELESLVQVVVKEKRSLLKDRDKYGETPLHIACRKGLRLEIIQRLVEECPDALRVACGRRGWTPIHVACSRKYSKYTQTLVKLLLKACPEALTIQDQKQWTPLHLAICSGMPRDLMMPVADLYEECLTLPATATDGDTPLHIACSTATSNSMTGAREGGGSSSSSSAAGNNSSAAGFDGQSSASQVTSTTTTVVGAVASLRPYIEFLLDKCGPRPLLAVNKKGQTPLHILCGPYLDFLDEDDHAALVMGSTSSHRSTSSTAPPTLSSSSSASFHLTVGSPQVLSPDLTSVLECYIQGCPQALHMCDRRGNTPLHLLCCGGSGTTASSGRGSGSAADPNAPSPTSSLLEWIQLLIDQYPEALVVRNAMGNTPLHMAVHAASGEPYVLDLVNLAIQKLPDALRVPDKEGRGLLHLLAEEYLFAHYNNNNQQQIQQQQQQQHRSSSRSSKNKEAAKEAASFAQSALSAAKLELFETIVNACPSLLQMYDYRGNTPLHLLCSADYDDNDKNSPEGSKQPPSNTVLWKIMKLAVDKCSSALRSVDARGSTPLHLLCSPPQKMMTMMSTLGADDSNPQQPNTPPLPGRTQPPLSPTKTQRSGISPRRSPKKKVTKLGVADLVDASESSEAVPDAMKKTSLEILTDTVQLAVERYPTTLLVVNRNGHTPLHNARRNTKYGMALLNVLVNLAVKSCPVSLSTTDFHGDNPLHTIFKENDTTMNNSNNTAAAGTGQDAQTAATVGGGPGTTPATGKDDELTDDLVTSIEQMVAACPSVLHQIDDEGNTPLHVLFSRKQQTPDSVFQLVAKAYPHAFAVRNQKSETPLHCAARIGKYLDVAVSLAIDCSPRVLSMTKTSGETALHIVFNESDLSFDYYRAVEKMVYECPEVFRMQDKLKNTPLHSLCRRGQNRDADMLKRRDVILDHVVPLAVDLCPDAFLMSNLKYQSLLHVLFSGDGVPDTLPFAVELIVNRCGKVLLMGDEEGNTPLHLLCERKQTSTEIVQFVTNRCPQALNIINDRGDTPLHVTDTKDSFALLLTPFNFY